MMEKLQELLKNEEIVAKLLEMDEDTEIQALLKENGVELSLEEIAALKKGVIAQLNGEEAELSEDDLEDVAGGFAITLATLGTIAGIFGATATGIGAAAKLGHDVHTWSRGRW